MSGRETFGSWLHAVSLVTRMRILVRRSEIWLTLCAIIVGALSGLATVAISAIAYGLQHLLFGLPEGVRLSAMSHLSGPFVVLLPFCGGVLIALASLWVRATKRRMIDPVEANALHGGKLSATDSFGITCMTIISNGFGASVGLEAAYVQSGSAFGSKLGAFLHARRSDLRLLVGCGAAGSIAAAFDAPLAGAFYAFELVIGTYTITSLAPVVAAAVAATFVADLFREGHTLYHFEKIPEMTGPLFMSLAGLALVTALCGIALMVLVSTMEKIISFTKIPTIYRPLIGGVLLIPVVAFAPFALSAGHGALQAALSAPTQSLSVLILMIAIKVLASAISLGSGFRGGLFFASLFIGALIGQAWFLLMQNIAPGLVADQQLTAIIGMTGLAAAVVGGPLTMSFLALESSGSLTLAIVVLSGAAISSLVVRRLFGYSFTTWRFHLRGEAIRSAHDIGFIRSLTVGRMMRPDVRKVDATMTVREFRNSFPLGSAKQLVSIRGNDEYAGMLAVADIWALDEESQERPVSDFAVLKGVMLVPWMNAKQAAVSFEAQASDVMVIVSDMSTRRVIGTLSESYLLRRYAEELDKAREDMSGATKTYRKSGNRKKREA